MTGKRNRGGTRPRPKRRAERREEVVAPSRRNPLVGVIMGSASDAPTMAEAEKVLREFGIPHERRVVSAHRTPGLLFEYAAGAAARGLEVIIAGAGGAAHLPGMTASLTTLPVVGVPVESRALRGLDSLLSIAQMPAGVPVATMAVGNARNAGLMAARILSIKHPRIAARLSRYARRRAAEVRAEAVLRWRGPRRDDRAGDRSEGVRRRP